MSGLRSAARGLVRPFRRQPSGAALFVAVLALGSGFPAAAVGLLDVTVLRPLPYPQAERLVTVWHADPREPDRLERVTPGELRAWSGAQTRFELLAAGQLTVFPLRHRGSTEEILAAGVGADFFPLLGAEPVLGRLFVAAEDGPQAPRLVILGYDLWQRRFGGDPGIVGEPVTLARESPATFTVVGVLPASFTPPSALRMEKVELWTNLASSFRGPGEMAEPDRRCLYAIGRLREDATPDQVQAELATLAGRESLEQPDDELVVEPLERLTTGETTPLLFALVGPALLVLLVAGTDLALLQLSRTMDREAELAARLVLGASRSNLVGLAVAEIVPLAVIGGALSLPTAGLFSTLLRRAVAPDVGAAAIQQATWTALAASLIGVTLLTCAASVAPLLRLSAVRPARALDKASSALRTSRRRQRGQRLVLAMQAAFALVMVIGAVLLSQSLFRLAGVDTGFDPRRVLVVGAALPMDAYPERWQEAAFIAEAAPAIGSLPRVQTVGFTTELPLLSRLSPREIEIEGVERDRSGFGPTEAEYRRVTPGYFEVLRIPLLAGRVFHDTDPNAPLEAVVNASFRRRWFAGREILGARLRVRDRQSDGPWMTIVGVIGDVRHESLRLAARPEVYAPLLRDPHASFIVVARTEGEPLHHAVALRNRLWQLDDTVVVGPPRSMKDLLAEELREPRSYARLIGGLALLAAALALAGCYGVTADWISRRRPELGLRAALGAPPKVLVAEALSAGLAPAGAGILAGLVLAAVLTRSLVSLLYGVDPANPWTFAAVAVVLALAAGGAALVPARRALAVDPASLLKGA